MTCVRCVGVISALTPSSLKAPLPDVTVVVTPAGRRSWPALSLTCATGTASFVRGTMEGQRGTKDVLVKVRRTVCVCMCGVCEV